MKLLFLDIDGVLNNYRSRIVLGSARTIENLDPLALKLIQKVVKETGCVICLSSNWRLNHSFLKLGQQLDLPILFETPNLGEDKRAREIQEVVDGLQPDKYAVLDDEESHNEFAGMPFVNVADEDGVGYKDYLLLLEYLK